MTWVFNAYGRQFGRASSSFGCAVDSSVTTLGARQATKVVAGANHEVVILDLRKIPDINLRVLRDPIKCEAG
jgi:hypothetical protein